MLDYAHINPVSMLVRFRPEEGVRVATDSTYVQKTALYKLQDVEAYATPRLCHCGNELCVRCLTGQAYLGEIAPAQWRDKGE